MKKRIIILFLFCFFVSGCATVVVKQEKLFSMGAATEEVVENIGEPLYARKIMDGSGDTYEIYRYKAEALFESFNPTPFYNKRSIQSFPADVVFKNGRLILWGIRVQGNLFDGGQQAEKEMLRSIDWHLQQDEKRYRTSLFW